MAKIIKSVDDVWLRNKQAMWDILGPSITRIPVQMWETNMFLHSVKNNWWLEKTGTFPDKAKSKGSHPLYVLKTTSTGFRVCPCSSKQQDGKYIKKGCELQKTGKYMDRDSYILEKFRFNISRTMHFAAKPTLYGIVPKHCLGGVHHEPR